MTFPTVVCMLSLNALRVQSLVWVDVGDRFAQHSTEWWGVSRARKGRVHRARCVLVCRSLCRDSGCSLSECRISFVRFTLLLFVRFDVAFVELNADVVAVVILSDISVDIVPASVCFPVVAFVTVDTPEAFFEVVVGEILHWIPSFLVIGVWRYQQTVLVGIAMVDQYKSNFYAALERNFDRCLILFGKSDRHGGISRSSFLISTAGSVSPRCAGDGTCEQTTSVYRIAQGDVKWSIRFRM
jgi:hypothetical protein